MEDNRMHLSDTVDHQHIGEIVIHQSRASTGEDDCCWAVALWFQQVKLFVRNGKPADMSSVTVKLGERSEEPGVGERAFLRNLITQASTRFNMANLE